MSQTGPHHDSSDLYKKIDDILDESGGNISEKSKRKLDDLLGKLPNKKVPPKKEVKKDGNITITIPDFKMPGFMHKPMSFLWGIFTKVDNFIFRAPSRKNNSYYHRRQRPRQWS